MKAIGTVLLAGLPALAHAQTQPQVPAIIQGSAAAAVSVAGTPPQRVENGDNTSFILYPLINRSRALAYIQYTADSAGLGLRGCGLAFKVAGAKRAGYTITLSLITPYLRLTGDGNPQAFLEGERGRLARASEDGGFKLNGKPVVAAELAA